AIVREKAGPDRAAVGRQDVAAVSLDKTHLVEPADMAISCDRGDRPKRRRRKNHRAIRRDDFDAAPATPTSHTRAAGRRAHGVQPVPVESSALLSRQPKVGERSVLIIKWLQLLEIDQQSVLG